jgi:hypothetical protein
MSAEPAATPATPATRRDMPSDATAPTDRQVRALAPREHLLVVPDDPATFGPDEWAVYSGEERYHVRPALGQCDCPDAQYNCGPEECCKHVWRARFERDGLPWWADGDAVCEMFRAVRGDRDE